MRVSDGGRAQKHKDDGLAHAAEHLHKVLHSRLRLLRNVKFDILLHDYATERQPKKSKSWMTKGTLIVKPQNT